jgi:hypothetical protein
MGFAIKKTNAASGRSAFLGNFLLFKVNDRRRNPNYSSYQNPFQEFVWGDYTLGPGREYGYDVIAM